MKNNHMDLMDRLSYNMIFQKVGHCWVTTINVMNLFFFLMNPFTFFQSIFSGENYIGLRIFCSSHSASFRLIKLLLEKLKIARKIVWGRLMVVAVVAATAILRKYSLVLSNICIIHIIHQNSFFYLLILDLKIKYVILRKCFHKYGFVIKFCLLLRTWTEFIRYLHSSSFLLENFFIMIQLSWCVLTKTLISRYKSLTSDVRM